LLPSQAYHFCDYDDKRTCSSAHIIKHWARQLCQLLGDDFKDCVRAAWRSLEEEPGRSGF
jgi:hypothetical protein